MNQLSETQYKIKELKRILDTLQLEISIEEEHL